MLLNKNILAIGIVFLFVCSAFIPLSLGINTRIADTTEQPSTFSRGKTLYVGGTGEGNYTKIQDAIDNASDGDTVYVYDDSSPYYELVVIDKSINLIGEDRDTTIIDGSEGDIINIYADRVDISGFTIQNSGYNWDDAGIEIMHSSYNSITGNIISNNYHGIILYTNSNTISDNIITSNFDGGLILLGSKNNIISINTFSDNVDGVILDGGSDYNNILDNVFFNDGVRISFAHQNTFSNNLINGKPIVYLEGESDVVIDDEDAGQVILVSCNSITVQDQNLSNTSVGLTLIDTDNCLISDNIITNNTRGICTKGSCNNSIEDNTFFNNKEWTIILDEDSNYDTVSGNTIDHPLGTYPLNGISVYEVTGNNILGNTIKNCYSGISLGDSDYNIILNNEISSNDRDGIAISDGSNNKIIGNNISYNLYWGIEVREGSNDNVIYHNNLVYNKRNAIDEGDNIWDDGKYGNYWSDYQER
ncbi:MAG: nitrous oxide reductase family maturation protein NosD, partial [Candidatus Hodarchaeota archaeon]